MKWSAAPLGGHMPCLRTRWGDKVCHAEINSLMCPTTADREASLRTSSLQKQTINPTDNRTNSKIHYRFHRQYCNARRAC